MSYIINIVAIIIAIIISTIGYNISKCNDYRSRGIGRSSSSIFEIVEVSFALKQFVLVPPLSAVAHTLA